MKNLDLKAYGVNEMNCSEMEKIDGGGWLEVATIVAAVAISPVLAVAVVVTAATSQDLH